MNDKLFEAIAAVPWIPEPVGDDRVRAINDEIVPRLEKEGWRVSRDVIERIWRGERDDAILLGEGASDRQGLLADAPGAAEDGEPTRLTGSHARPRAPGRW